MFRNYKWIFNPSRGGEYEEQKNHIQNGECGSSFIPKNQYLLSNAGKELSKMLHVIMTCVHVEEGHVLHMKR